MTKIKITPKQYKSILIFEQNLQKTSLNDTFDISDNVIEEGVKEVLLGVAMLMGLGLTGANKAAAQTALSNSETMAQIKSTLENEQKTKELANIFAEKGLDNPDSLLAKNANKVVDKYNELAQKNNIDYRITSKVVDNLENLDIKLKQGYALSKSDISTDTIKGIDSTYTLIVKDTVEFELGNDNLFITGGYDISPNGIETIKSMMDSIEKQGGKILSVNIESSTDAESAPKFRTEYDQTGNVKLAELRTQSVSDVFKNINNDISITHREIPNNGSDVVNSKQFAAARNNPKELSALRAKTAEFRYVKINIVVEYEQEVKETIKPEEIIKNYRFELVKVIGTNKTLSKSDKRAQFKNKQVRCSSSKTPNRSNQVKCATF